MVVSSSLANVLVTGATGRHGGTSARVVQDLLRAGYKTKVLARSLSERTAVLSGMGAEIVLGDFNDRKSLMTALAEVDVAAFTYPIAGGIVPAAATFASAIREAQSPIRVVALSMAVAHPDSPSPLGRAQWLAEEVFSWSGVDLCVLRIAGLFFENIGVLHGQSIKEKSRFSNSFGSAEVPWISGLDAARLMTAAIIHPDRFPGHTIHYPPGVELLSHAAIAEILSMELKRSIHFEPITQDEWTKELTIRAAQESPGIVNADMANHISAVGGALSSMKAPVRLPDPFELQRLTGFTPLHCRDYIIDNIALFK